MAGPRRWLSVEALVSALTEKKVDLGISWREAARQAGVSAPIFTRLRQGKEPDVNTFWALVRWLDMPAETFQAGSARDHLPPLLQSLVTDRALSPKAKATVEELVQLIYRLAKIFREDRALAQTKKRTRAK
jgi:transcriptional regulator with XRE-family HTH domain